MATLNGYQKAAIKAKARVSAQEFVDEFNEPLDPAETDWDGTAFDVDKSELDFVNNENKDEAFEIYSAELAKETERLCEEA